MSYGKRFTDDDVQALQKRRTSQRIDKKAAKRKAMPKETANEMTRNILRSINFQTRCFAGRVNSTGVWDEKKHLFRKSHMQKGIFDIHATIRGRSCWIEVKAGKDKMSANQCIFKKDVDRAGGITFVAYSTDEFLTWFTELITKLK